MNVKSSLQQLPLFDYSSHNSQSLIYFNAIIWLVSNRFHAFMRHTDTHTFWCCRAWYVRNAAHSDESKARTFINAVWSIYCVDKLLMRVYRVSAVVFGLDACVGRWNSIIPMRKTRNGAKKANVSERETKKKQAKLNVKYFAPISDMHARIWDCMVRLVTGAESLPNHNENAAQPKTSKNKNCVISFGSF